MARAAVVGTGMTEFGVHDMPLHELFSEAAFGALDDAGVRPPDIDALYFGNAMGGQTENETHLGPKSAGHIGMAGLPVQRFEDACATSATAFKNAVEAVEAGIHDVVLVGGVERCTPETGKDTPEMTRIFASASHRQYEQPTGLTFPGVFALLTKRHMHEYGTTEEQLAHVAVKNHGNGALNPKAHFGKQTTVDEVLEGPIVADPFRLMDCCPFSDGASAAVVVNTDLADSYRDPVDVAGVGHATDVVPFPDQETPHHTRSARRAARQAYEQADTTAAAMDFAEVHDCFTGAEILASEAIGFVEDGNGGVAVENGQTARSGSSPINPSGGLKAKGHPIGATGTGQIFELTTQLRGDAGDRQIQDAERAIAHNLGGDAATTVVTVMEARS